MEPFQKGSSCYVLRVVCGQARKKCGRTGSKAQVSLLQSLLHSLDNILCEGSILIRQLNRLKPTIFHNSSGYVYSVLTSFSFLFCNGFEFLLGTGAPWCEYHTPDRCHFHLPLPVCFGMRSYLDNAQP